MVLLAAFGVSLDLMPAARAQNTGPVLSGTVAEQRYQRGQAITSLVLPAATGGTGTLTYSLSPSLPAGLSLDLATRTVSGTPSEVLGRTNFTWKVTDGGGGEDSLTFFLRVTAEAGIPNAPTLTSVVPGSAAEQLVVTFSWSGACAILGPTAGYTVEYRKLTSSWRSPALVTASSPNDKNSGAFAIFDELGAGPVTGETFTINSSSAGQTNLGQIGVALDPEPYEIRASVYSGVGGCDAYSLYSNVVRSTPLSRVPLLDATVADQVYVQGVAITDLVLPAATGGNAPLSYALVGALLPSGLDYISATRTLSGTPTALQSATTYTWRVTDRDGQTAEDTFTIEVTPAPLALSGTVAQQRYTRGQAITPLVLPAATGGTAPLTYALSPSTLPAGLQFDGATRTVSGTPTELFEPVEFTWKVTDSAQEEDSLTFFMTVNAEVGVPNAPTLTAVVPGSAPEQLVVTFSWSGPSCPILGTRAGYTVEYRKLTSSWRPAALVTASSPNDVNSGAFAIFEELGAGPIAGKAFTINSSSAGQTTLGQIGVALDPEPYEVRVLVSSGVGGCDADSPYSNVVRSTPVSGTPVLDATVADQVYTQNEAITQLVLPAASGGNAPLTYQLLGALPAGLGYDSATRTLSGTPTVAQAATTYTWKVTDAGGDADEDTFTIEVTPAPLVLSGTVERQRYTKDRAITPLVLPAATGGTAPLTYTLGPSLPDGLSLDVATRTVSGTPTEVFDDTYFSWEVTDNAGEKASVGFFMSVKASAGFPDPPTLTSVVPGSALAQLVVTFSWSGPCAILGPRAGYAVEYRKLTSSWRPAALVSASSPNDVNSGAFSIREELGAGPITGKTFTINSSSAGRTTFGQIGVALDPEPYEVRVLVSSGVGGCDVNSRYSNVVRATPLSGVPRLDAKVADQRYVQGVAITDLVLPAAAGGSGALTYRLVGELPEGLDLIESTRTIAGTPTETQAATTYTWKVTDADGNTDEETFTIEVTLVAPAPPVLSGTVAEQNYLKDQAITPLVLPTATGGTGTLTYTLSPSTLPAGVEFDVATRTLSGTPTEVFEPEEFTWKVTDEAGEEDSLTFFIAVEANSGVPNAPTLTSVVPGSAPEQLVVTFSWSGPCAILGPRAGYTVQYRKLTSSWRSPALVTASSPNDKNSGAFALFEELGAGPITGKAFTINSASAGETNEGQIGVALDPEPYEVRVNVYSGVGGCDEYSPYSNVVRATPLSGVPALDATVPDQSYVEGVKIADLVLPAATGGNGTLAYALVGNLPPGLTVDTATRTLSGTPESTQAATTYTWQVTDADGDTDEETFTIEVVENTSPALEAIGNRSYVRGVAIEDLVLPAATGGDDPLTYVLEGDLPQGLVYDTATRTVSGTPSAAQAATTYTWRVTDRDDDRDEKTFTIEVVHPPLELDGTVAGQRYLKERAITPLVLPAASGGTGPGTYMYTLSPTVPDGLSVDLSTRTVSGAPTAVQAAATYTWKVTDGDGVTAEETFTIEVLDDSRPVLGAIEDRTYVRGVAIESLVLPAATGGDDPLSYVLEGDLPQGLVYDSATRTVSGTPSAAQAVATYTWSVTDRDDDRDEQTFTIEVVHPPLELDGTVAGQRYLKDRSITPLVLPAASGGTGPGTYMYAVSPTLPDGLSLDSSTRTVSGAPTAVQAALTYTWKVTDGDGVTAEETFTIEVLDDSRPVLGAIEDRTYVRGVAIESLVLPAATGGDDPLTYVLEGDLPQGLAYDSATRTVSGTPTAAQAAATYTWSVTDRDDDRDEQTFTIEVVHPPLELDGTVAGQRYLKDRSITPLVLPAASGGTGPGTYMYALSPTLPDGLSLDSSTRTVSGAPTAVQAALTYTWKVTDGDGVTAEETFTIEVLDDSRPVLGAIEDRTYVRGVAIESLVLPAATGGDDPLTYVLEGDLPQGLAYDSATRTVTGTPTAAQAAATYTWSVTDRDDDRDEQTFTIEVVHPPLELDGTVAGQRYLKDRSITPLVLPAASGGTGPGTYMYALSPTLPGGLSLDSSTRTVSGRPDTVQRATTYTWKVTDGDGVTAEETFTIEVLDDSRPVLGAIEDRTYVRGVAIESLVLPTATGGDDPLTYVLEGDLPQGLAYDSATRTVTGTPTAAQAAATYTWSVTDRDDDRDEQTFTIEVVHPPLELDGTVAGQRYLKDRSITPLVLPAASGGTGPGTYMYALSPTLPGGLSLDSSTRTVSGRPDTVQRATTYTWKVTDGDGVTAEATFTIEVLDDSRPVLGAIEDRTYVRGVAIESLVLPAATGGDDPLTYVLEGDLPQGLAYDSATRTVTGTPTAAQAAATYTWSVTDRDDDRDEQTFTIEVVHPPLELDGTVAGQRYLKDRSITPLVLPAASGGTGPGTYMYALSPTLPGGLSLDSSTRTVSGRPDTVQRATTYTWKVTDGDGVTAEETFTIEVLDDSRPVLEAIEDRTYVRGVAIESLVLPAATGGDDPLAYVLDGDLPQGLAYDSATRTVSGTPSAAQAAATYTWSVTDRDDDRDEQTFTIEVVHPPLELDGTVAGQRYLKDRSITPLVLPAASGGTGPGTYMYALSPTLPGGLSLDSSTRTVSGRPDTVQRATTYTWKVTDGDGVTDEETFTIEVLDDSRPVLGAIEDRTYVRGVAIESLVLPAATGGDDPLAYVLDGDLPQGLAYDSATRTVSGTPSAAQAAATYTWRVTDRDDDSDEQTFTIEVVHPPLELDGTVAGQRYLKDRSITPLVLPAASGGTGPGTYMYALSPTLPGGLSLDSSTRTVSGRPDTVQRATTYTWKVTDGDGVTAEETFTIEVLDDSRPVLGAIEDRTYVRGVAIESLVLPAATGGDDPLTYVLEGDLPQGLVYDSARGTVSGTPSAAQAAATYTWKVTDRDGETDEQTFTIEVVHPPLVLDGTVAGQRYLKDRAITPLVLPAASGGTGPGTYMYALSPTLPDGLSLDVATRTVSGTPSAVQAAATYTWKVTDGAGATAEETFTIDVQSDGTLTLSGTVGELRYVRGEAITALVLPAATGGRAPLTYTLTGRLPDGLQFDSATRTVSGTPTALQDRATYTWQVEDADRNRDSLTFGITVVEGSQGGGGVPDPGTRIFRIDITSTPAFGSTYRLGEVVEVTLSFTRVVYVTGEPGLTLQVGTQRYDARYLRGSGSNRLVFAYTVASGDLDEDGLSVNPGRIRIQGNSEVSDRRGPRSIWSHPSLLDDPAHKVSGKPLPALTRLAVVSDPGDDEAYSTGDVIEVEALFSSVVEVAGSPTLDIQVGESSRPAVYQSGSGTDRLLFAYRVQVSDRDENGIAIAAGVRIDPPAAITEPGGTPANLASAGLADQSGHRVDGEGTAITSLRIVSDPGPDETYRPGEEIRVVAVFNQPVVVTGRLELELAIGAAMRRALFATGSGSTELVFAYRLQGEDQDHDGVSVPAGTLVVPSGAGLTDRDGLPVRLAHAGLADQAGHKVDGQGPAITSLRIVSDPGEDATYGQGDVIRFAVVYDEPALVQGRPELPIKLGATRRQASYESGSGGTELVFAYAVQEGDHDDDGVSLPTGTLVGPAGASVADRFGNPAVGGHGGLPDQPGHKVDGSAPAVTSLLIVSDPGADEIYTVGDAIRIEAVFDEPIFVTGEPRLGLAVGMHRRDAVFESGAGTRRLVFSYEISAEDEDLNGVSIPRGVITLPGEAALLDGAGNPAERAYGGLPDQSDHKVDGMQDLVAPTVSSLSVVSSAGSDGNYRTGDEIRLAVTFSEAVTVAGAAEIALTIGVTQQGAVYSSGSGSATLEFAYTVRAADRDDDGISVDANRLTGSGIADEAGNAAELAHEGLPAQPRHKVNLPTVTQAEKAILTKALGAIAGNMISSVTNNIGTRFTTLRGRPGPSLTLAGQRVDLNGSEEAAAYLMAGARRRGFGMGRMTGEDMLRGTAFSLPFGPSGRNGQAPAWTAWGLGDLAMFEGQGQLGSDFSGTLRSAYAGVDVRLGQDVLAGVAVSRSMGEADYSFGAGGGPRGAGGLQTTLTNIHPYLRARTGDRGEIWTVLGIGRGKAENSPSERAKESSDLSMIMAAGGTRQEIGKAGALGLAFTADAGYARLMTGGGEQALDGLTAEAWRVRGGVELSGTASIGSGGSAAMPFVSASVRNDGGNGAVGTGLEVAGGIRVLAPESRVGLEAKGRYLAMHTESGYKEWGASVVFTLAARPDGGGPSLSVAPRIGASADDASLMWRDQGLGTQAYGALLASTGPRVDMRGGWGFRMSRLTLTPFAEVILGTSRAGVQLAPSFADFRAVRFEVAAERMSYMAGRPDNRITVSLTKLF